MDTTNQSAPFDVARTFDGKKILVIGTTGFVGKVALSMLLRRYPNIGKVFALVRPGAGNTAEDRFFKKVATSPAFDPLRELWGDGYESFMREKVVPIPGDIGRELCNFTDAEWKLFEEHGGVDAIINSAGLVSFTPSLESAIRINAEGARNCLEVARKLGAALVHVSTCYVAGRRDGEVWEDEEVVGYFPRKDELHDDDFDAEAEIADCRRIIEHVRDRSNDRAHISEFRERGAARLEEERRDPDDQASLRLAAARERKIWMHTRLTELGAERAEHWGWTNTYTYTKSLGEQVILADKEVRATVVRPAIVESAMHYPFSGWNEGFNTTAPLVYLMLKGHRSIVVGSHTPLDVIPVDYVCAGLLMATAAILDNRHKRVYQLGSSDSSTTSSRRLVELTALAIRQYRHKLADEGEDEVSNRIRARLQGVAVTADAFDRRSAPQIKRVADGLRKLIDERLPTWGAPRVQAMAERAKDELAKVSEFSGRVQDVVELFMPFTHDHDIVFRADNIRALYHSMTPQDQQALYWGASEIDWRDYWFNVHFPGLQEWTFPVLDDEFGAKPRSVYTHKDLLELFDAATKLHKHRIAMRLLPSEADEGAVVYTYERVQDMAKQCAGALRQRGVVESDRVFLMSENRPEWGISYFGILKAGATAVPVDSGLSLAEVVNLLRSSESKVSLISVRVAERLLDDDEIEYDRGKAHAVLAGVLAEQGIDTQLCTFEDILAEPDVSPGALEVRRGGGSVASLIYTSGTTGEPKGVMLTDKNFTSMAAKLSQLFRLSRHDGLLSVLPLHHTFEFSAGFLMPILHGSQITYLEEITPDGLSDALRGGNITGLVGVPALWQLLHRRITKEISERGDWVRRAFDGVVSLNRSLRDRVPYEWNLGKLLFFPIHARFGGRLRLLISGGSALSPEVMKSFRGLGFRLFEGYGMTEASPVLTVQRPTEKTPVGSVGRALPGIDVKIDDPDENGVGEVIAKGPNVMKGYYNNAEATAEVIRGGWLHTGDLGRFDDEGNLYIVGRKKEMILGASGENVYPDELEELYGDSDLVKELSVVGIPNGDGTETVAGLIVPDYEYDAELSREEVRNRVREHVKAVSLKLPQYKRLKVWHLWDLDLPKTATRKVKRREVIAELEKLEAVSKSAVEEVGAEAKDDSLWVRDVIAKVAQKQGARLTGSTRLEELGFDSLMFTELGVAIEAAGVHLADAHELASLGTVSEVENYVAQHGRKRRAGEVAAKRIEVVEGDDIDIPEPLAELGRKMLSRGQRALYGNYLDTKVYGEAYVPPFGSYIVAANHASHLDMGLVKHALGQYGDRLVALAAKDYFFEDPVRRMYFENFTNLVPMERHGSLRESLRLAGETIRDGYILLIFPEGTRSTTGVMVDFKPSLGYLAMSNRCGILPMYLGGTHDAMPKGNYLPKRKAVSAHIGPFLSHADLEAMTAGMKRADGYRHIATHVEGIVRRLAPDDCLWSLGEAGRLPVAEFLSAEEGRA